MDLHGTAEANTGERGEHRGENSVRLRFLILLRLCVKRNEIIRAEKEICATFLHGFFSKDPAFNLANYDG